MALKEFAGAAAGTRLLGSLPSGTTSSFTVIASGGNNYPTGATAPFVVVIDRGTAIEEKILVNTRSGDVFGSGANGLTRGWDGTSPQTHSAQAIVEHVLDADTLTEANAHVNDDARDDHSQYLTNARHDIEGRHSFGVALGAPGTPSTVEIGDAADAGSGDDAAREDHIHAVGTPGAPTSGAVWSTAGATGSSVIPARSDHQHATPTVPSAAAITTSETTASTSFGNLTTPGPAVTVTTGTTVMVGFSANIGTPDPTGAMTCVGDMAVAVSGATTRAASAQEALSAQVLASSASADPITIAASQVLVISGLTAGSNTFTAQYRAVNGTATFYNRKIWVMRLN
jgi:hypothetical protein